VANPVSLDIINKGLNSDRMWRERLHGHWMLKPARNTVITIRLTQRQSVNVPYMKKTLKTYLTQTNWPVDNYYENQGNDKQSELFLNVVVVGARTRLRYFSEQNLSSICGHLAFSKWSFSTVLHIYIPLNHLVCHRILYGALGL
jgi:hypothetical protein